MESSSEESETPKTSPGTARKHIRSIKVKAKDRMQRLRAHSIPHSSDRLPPRTHVALTELEDNPAFDPEKVQDALEGHHEALHAKTGKTGSKLEHAIDAVLHPQQSARAKAARETAKTLVGQPGSAVTQGRDRAIVAAQDRLDEAKGDVTLDEILTRDTNAQPTEPEIYSERVVEMEEYRDKLKAGHAMTHVERARVVNPCKYTWPRRQDYWVFVNGKRVFNWKDYLGCLVLYNYQTFGAHYIDDSDAHPFDARVFRSHLERLAMVTAPWQAWTMDVRSVYRWEKPARTVRWMLIYTFLWYTQHVVLFLVGWIMWVVVRARLVHASADDVRRSVERAADSESAAWSIGELLDKHDSDAWLDEIGRNLGPGAQLYAGDVADVFEMVTNLCEWKSPTNTMAALSLLFAHMLLCLSDWKVAGHYVYGTIGLVFFVCWPIQSLYPKYRRIVSLVQILLFNVPTHAEWAFGYLRRQALMGQLAVVKHDHDEVNTGNSSISPTSSASSTMSKDDVVTQGARLVDLLGSTALISFRAHYNGLHGWLVIAAEGIRFQQTTSCSPSWAIAFEQLNELRKMDRVHKAPSKLRAITKDKAVSSGDRLLLQDTSGQERIVRLRKDRDQCFNCIIGFSGLKWQKLQTSSVPIADSCSGQEKL